MSARSDVRAAMAAVAHNRRLLAAQAAYALFAVVEQAVWVAVLLWAYAAGGTGLAGLVAVVQLVPAALLAPIGGVLGDRMRRDRALFLVYGLQAVVHRGASPCWCTRRHRPGRSSWQRRPPRSSSAGPGRRTTR